MLSVSNAGILILVLIHSGTLVAETVGGCTASPTPSPTPGTTTDTGHCTYEGVQYQQGETWYGECDNTNENPKKMKCTCSDGFASCKDLCIWDIPDEYNCTFITAPGMCCKVPDCPDGVDVPYPDGYEAV